MGSKEATGLCDSTGADTRQKPSLVALRAVGSGSPGGEPPAIYKVRRSVMTLTIHPTPATSVNCPESAESQHHSPGGMRPTFSCQFNKTDPLASAPLPSPSMPYAVCQPEFVTPHGRCEDESRTDLVQVGHEVILLLLSETLEDGGDIGRSCRVENEEEGTRGDVLPGALSASPRQAGLGD